VKRNRKLLKLYTVTSTIEIYLNYKYWPLKEHHRTQIKFIAKPHFVQYTLHVSAQKGHLIQDIILQSNTFVLGGALILQQLSVKTLGCYSRTNI
jgi:hypothetical protein